MDGQSVIWINTNMKKEAQLKKELKTQVREEKQRVKDIASLKKAVNMLQRDATNKHVLYLN